ncbi:hypothetical protein N665_0046s0002 [Sinapis alba]|nr:hypothetical protein N665_0046s0002 [Sinapis alba]
MSSSLVKPAVAVENGEWRPPRLGPKQGSVFPKERKLVKTMILEAVFPYRSPLKPKQIVEPPNSKRVQPTLR